MPSALARRSLPLLPAALALLAWAAPAPAQPAADERRTAGWEAVVDAVRHELPRLHPDAFHTTPRARFEAAAAALRDSIGALGDEALFTRVVRLVASLRDGHTAVDVMGMPLTRLPLHLARFPDGLYVTHAPPELGLRGARLLRVGRLDAGAAAAAVAPLAARDNDHRLELLVPAYLVVPEILAGLGVAEPGRPVPLELLAPGGDTLRVELAPVPRARWFEIYRAETRVPLYLSRPEPHYWADSLPGRDALYLRYNRARETPGAPLSALVARLLATADARPGIRLVVDLRGNPGGDSRLLEPLVEGIRARPALDRPDRLFVLIDEGTGSSALLNAVSLSRRARGTLVGEPTGARPNHYGEVRRFRLPGSGMQVSYPTRRFRVVEGDPPALEPDVLVEPDAAGHFAGRDPVLERALAHPPRP